MKKETKWRSKKKKKTKTIDVNPCSKIYPMCGMVCRVFSRRAAPPRPRRKRKWVSGHGYGRNLIKA